MSVRAVELLLLDDDSAWREQLARTLIKAGYQVHQAGTVREGMAILAERDIACCITDYYMPEQTGMDFLRELSEKGTKTAVVMMSGQGTIPLAVEAMKHGAIDFLQKPVRMAELQHVLERQLHQRRIERENVHLKEWIRKNSQE